MELQQAGFQEIDLDLQISEFMLSYISKYHCLNITA
jgi:hypothetical protein